MQSADLCVDTRAHTPVQDTNVQSNARLYDCTMFKLVLCAKGEECANTVEKAYVRAVAASQCHKG